LTERNVACLDADLFSYNADNAVGRLAAIEGEDAVFRAFMERDIALDRRFELTTEAYALRLAYANNKILSLSNSRTRILAHQVESTHRIVNALQQRFLLADEVGLGKTIEAGLVIKELVYRYAYKKILIVCPASLTIQWQHEMENKFNETFVLLDRRRMKSSDRGASAGANPWNVHDRVICSLDFIKNAAFRDALKRSRWDAVIFDEAHRLRRDSLKSTLAYNAAEIIAKNTKALLLLTATPFRGKLEELYYLIRLIDENLLGPYQSFYNEYCVEGADLSGLRSKLSPVLIRRTKKEVGGFTARHAKTVRFDLYPEERNLYDATTRYVVEEFNRALQTENRAVGFVMTVFQKLLDSSSFALLSALVNRRNNLAAMLERAERKNLDACGCPDELDVDAMDIDDSEDVDELVMLSLQKTVEELREEIATLESLIGIAKSIERNKKGEKLRELLRGLITGKGKKVVIFTQFRTTQDYLCGLLSDYSVVPFNGSMDRDRKEEAIQSFRDGADVLICTEAGGEGRNMQFCNILINYDLPWSPLKVEQRIGRVHRFGQPYDVYIYNFATRDTVAERVLEVLTRKLKLFEESIGVPDVLLGQMEDELNLTALFMEAAAGGKSKKAMMAEVDEKIKNARRSYEKLSELTVARNMDFNYDEYYAITMKERQFSNRRIESFVNRLRDADQETAKLIGPKNRRNGLYAVKGLSGDGVRRFGTFDSRIALDNESLEFLAFGHPLVDHLFCRCESESFGGVTGIRIIRHHTAFTGMLFNYLVTYEGWSVTRELLPVAVDIDEMADDPELEEIERETIYQEGLDAAAAAAALHGVIGDIRSNAEELFARAGERAQRLAQRRAMEISETLDLSIDPELEKIRDASGKRLRELAEQMDRQECQKKWFGRDMKSALSRTRNEIARIEKERELLTQRYTRSRNVRYAVQLINAGIIIAVTGE